MKTYYEKLKDPRWQKKRLEILQRDNFTCKLCNNNKNTLNVHHLKYSKEPWETPNEYLITTCEDCHEYYHITLSEIEDMLKIDLIKNIDSIHGLLIDVIKFNENDFVELNKIMKLKWPDKTF